MDTLVGPKQQSPLEAQYETMQEEYGKLFDPDKVVRAVGEVVARPYVDNYTSVYFATEGPDGETVPHREIIHPLETKFFLQTDDDGAERIVPVGGEELHRRKQAKKDADGLVDRLRKAQASLWNVHSALFELMVMDGVDEVVDYDRLSQQDKTTNNIGKQITADLQVASDRAGEVRDALWEFELSHVPVRRPRKM